jgi:hypothetical protein
MIHHLVMVTLFCLSVMKVIVIKRLMKCQLDKCPVEEYEVFQIIKN